MSLRSSIRYGLKLWVRNYPHVKKGLGMADHSIDQVRHSVATASPHGHQAYYTERGHYGSLIQTWWYIPPYVCKSFRATRCALAIRENVKPLAGK